MKTAVALISGMLILSVSAQSGRVDQITVPLSNPSQPGVLIVHHHKGSINVTGYEGTSVVVKASLRFRSDVATPAIDLGVAEKDNHVVLSAGPRHRTIDLDILVPRRFSLRLKNDDSGTIRIQHLSGEMEVSNLHGGIHLLDVAGSVLLDTVDGNITAQLTRLTPGAPMAFTSLEGNLDITFPHNARALIRMKADQGRIRNEFASASQATSSSASRRRRASWVYARANGGGPEMRLHSFHGHIHLRRAESAKNAPDAVTIPD